MANELLTDLVPPIAELKRVGPIYDANTYLRSGEASLNLLRKFAYLKPQHSVLDIGCGYGRVAIQLSQFLAPTSRYVGVDVVAEEIKWCSANISRRYPNFTFEHLNVHNQMYNPRASQKAREAKLPAGDEQFDLVFLFSVFTHMLPADVAAYAREIARVLKPGGILFASFFLINWDSYRFMHAGKSSRTFVEQDGYFVSNQKVHEGAVGYKDDVAWKMLLDAGFARDKIIYGKWTGRQPGDAGQDCLVCSKYSLEEIPPLRHPG